jgi:hypothetical protein
MAQLRLMDLRPAPHQITIPVRVFKGRKYDHTEERPFEVRSDLPVDVLLNIRMYEDRFDEASAAEKAAKDELEAAEQKGDADWIARAAKKVEAADSASFELLDEANEDMRALLLEQTKLAPGERIVLSMPEIMALIGFLASFRKAITGNIEATAEEALEAAASAAEALRDQEKEEDREPPLRSRKRSSNGSSSSTSTSGSGRSGGSGKKSRGRRSSPTRPASVES